MRKVEPNLPHDRLEATAPLLRPVMAVLDAVEDPRGDKRAVLQTALDTYAPQILLSTAAASYGIAGLVLGSLVAEALVSAAVALVRRRDHAQPRGS